MIDRERRFIFVHIPKTAGSSVTNALGFEWQNHKDLARYRRELGTEEFARYFKFTIVRNPWERLLSDYCFQSRWSGRRTSKLHIHDGQGRRRNFQQWVRQVLADPFAYEARAWGGTVSKNIHRWSPQVDWITLDGAIGVDFIARMECLRTDFGKLCERIGFEVPELPRRKKIIRRHYADYYDEETRELVTAFYLRDVQAFGYVFETPPPRSLWQRMLARLPY